MPATDCFLTFSTQDDDSNLATSTTSDDFKPQVEKQTGNDTGNHVVSTSGSDDENDLKEEKEGKRLDQSTQGRREALAEVARRIREIINEAKTCSYPNPDLASKIQSLKSRSPTGHNILQVLLRRERIHPMSSVASATRSVSKSVSEEEEEEDEGASEDKMELLPDISLSSSDLLSLEETFNAASPFSNLDEVSPLPRNASTSPSLQDVANTSSDVPNAIQDVSNLSTHVFVEPKEEEPEETAEDSKRDEDDVTQPKATSRDPDRQARFARTAEILSKSGLLDITMKTAELMRKNQQVSKELAVLKRETADFVRAVFANPENAGLLSLMHGGGQTRVFVSQNMDFQVLGEGGQMRQLPTTVACGQAGGSMKRKVGVNEEEGGKRQRVVGDSC